MAEILRKHREKTLAEPAAATVRTVREMTLEGEMTPAVASTLLLSGNGKSRQNGNDTGKSLSVNTTSSLPIQPSFPPVGEKRPSRPHPFAHRSATGQRNDSHSADSSGSYYLPTKLNATRDPNFTVYGARGGSNANASGEDAGEDQTERQYRRREVEKVLRQKQA